MATDHEKLKELIALEAISEDDVVHYAFSSTNPGICMMDGCNYTTDVEPDQNRGWCESCDKKTVKSLSVLAGII